MKDGRFDDLQRRGFLIRCCEIAGALLVPYDLSCAEPALSQPEFHFHPHYRERTPLDAALLQIKPGADGFLSETTHDKIAAVLNDWSAGLLGSPVSTEPITAALDESFRGSSWQAAETHPLRPSSNLLEIRLCRFATASLNREAFAADLESSLSPFTKFFATEFQMTRIETTSTGIRTQVRYELVGTGHTFHREARVGEWTLDWKAISDGSYRVSRWDLHGETRSRSLRPLFAETTDRAFSDCPSFRSQMLRGVDHWRNILDSACGTDIYGHSGVSVGDIDGTGRDSIYVCQPAGLPNRLYRNRGDGTFEDVTESSGLGLLDNTACALFADFSNNGRQDLVVVRASGPLLFLNDGHGKFHRKDGAFQFATPPQGTFTGAAAADYDRDGRLDLYFCLYTFYQGADQYRYPTPYFAAENGPPNFLMHNRGDGTFRDVTVESGLNKNNTRYSFCCAWGDSNGDGWPDLYVVNDFGRKNLYRSNGDGTFTDIAAEAGVEDTGAGMSVCWLDYDNDGAQDLYVANMWTAAGERITNDPDFQKQAPSKVQALYRKHAMGNSLFQNQGNRTFGNQTQHAGTGMGRWSWSSDVWDFDHDGFADLYVTNGMISGPLREDLNSFFWRQVVANSPNVPASSAEYEQGWNAINELIRSGYSWSGYERNVVYANNHDGTFADVSGALGLDFEQDSRTFALADLDGDGRLEMLLKNRNAPQLRLIRNIIPDLPPAIAFRLRGTKSNRDAIGARVTIETNAGRQTRYLQAGSGFLSQHSKELFFGLGQATGTVSA
ncbi:MAG TPA: CRTAC1 family protein, partial [Bryobacteraceae bacterium]|nr:CRTAC1 family protein [Bryobacteraceae bacterium]